jgi:hypothetical protein
MTSPIDNQAARAHPRDNSASAAGNAGSAITASASKESSHESSAGDDAAWEAEVDRVAEPTGSLEDTLRAILTEIADDVL